MYQSIQNKVKEKTSSSCNLFKCQWRKCLLKFGCKL